MTIKKLLKSFKYAFSGIFFTVKTEQNMRIHITVASLIVPFAYFFGISKTEWIALILVIGFVVFAELFNTALENLADSLGKEQNVFIKAAKDTAAGAVTVAAITSVIIGIFLFGDLNRIKDTLVYIITHLHSIVIFVCLLISDTILLFKKG